MIVSGVSGMREDYRDARSVFGVWSNTFHCALSLVLTNLTTKNTAVICLSFPLSQMGAMVQVGRCVVHIWAGGLQWDPIWYCSCYLHSSQLPLC